MNMFALSEEENQRLVGGRSKKSGRRSSILKVSRSPTRNVLEDLDPNADAERTTNLKRASRRVSFAQTCSVKEFVPVPKQTQPAWLNAELEEPKPNHVSDLKRRLVAESIEQPAMSDSTNSAVSVSGLQMLMTGEIENSVLMSQAATDTQSPNSSEILAVTVNDGFDVDTVGTNQPEYDGLLDGSGGASCAKNVNMANRKWETGSESQTIDSTDFLKKLMANPENRDVSNFLYKPEARSRSKSSREIDATINASVNKYSTLSAQPRAEPVSHASDKTLVFGGEGEDMEFTEAIAAPDAFASKAHSGQSFLNVTWATDSTKVYSRAMDLTRCVSADSHGSAQADDLCEETRLFGGMGEEMELTTALTGQSHSGKQETITPCGAKKIDSASFLKKLSKPVDVSNEQKIDSSSFLQSIGSRNKENKEIDKILGHDFSKTVKSGESRMESLNVVMTGETIGLDSRTEKIDTESFLSSLGRKKISADTDSDDRGGCGGDGKIDTVSFLSELSRKQTPTTSFRSENFERKKEKSAFLEVSSNVKKSASVCDVKTTSDETINTTNFLSQLSGGSRASSAEKTSEENLGEKIDAVRFLQKLGGVKMSTERDLFNESVLSAAPGEETQSGQKAEAPGYVGVGDREGLARDKKERSSKPEIDLEHTCIFGANGEENNMSLTMCVSECADVTDPVAHNKTSLQAEGMDITLAYSPGSRRDCSEPEGQITDPKTASSQHDRTVLFDPDKTSMADGGMEFTECLTNVVKLQPGVAESEGLQPPGHNSSNKTQPLPSFDKTVLDHKSMDITVCAKESMVQTASRAQHSNKTIFFAENETHNGSGSMEFTCISQGNLPETQSSFHEKYQPELLKSGNLGTPDFSSKVTERDKTILFEKEIGSFTGELELTCINGPTEKISVANGTLLSSDKTVIYDGNQTGLDGVMEMTACVESRNDSAQMRDKTLHFTSGENMDFTCIETSKGKMNEVKNKTVYFTEDEGGQTMDFTCLGDNRNLTETITNETIHYGAESGATMDFTCMDERTSQMKKTRQSKANRKSVCFNLEENTFHGGELSLLKAQMKPCEEVEQRGGENPAVEPGQAAVTSIEVGVSGRMTLAEQPESAKEQETGRPAPDDRIPPGVAQIERCNDGWGGVAESPEPDVTCNTTRLMALRERLIQSMTATELKTATSAGLNKTVSEQVENRFVTSQKDALVPRRKSCGDAQRNAPVETHREDQADVNRERHCSAGSQTSVVDILEVEPPEMLLENISNLQDDDLIDEVPSDRDAINGETQEPDMSKTHDLGQPETETTYEPDREKVRRFESNSSACGLSYSVMDMTAAHDDPASASAASASMLLPERFADHSIQHVREKGEESLLGVSSVDASLGILSVPNLSSLDGSCGVFDAPQLPAPEEEGDLQTAADLDYQSTKSDISKNEVTQMQHWAGGEADHSQQADEADEVFTDSAVARKRSSTESDNHEDEDREAKKFKSTLSSSAVVWEAADSDKSRLNSTASSSRSLPDPAPDPADRTAVEEDKSRFNSTASSSILLCHAPDPADRTAVEAVEKDKSRFNSTASSSILLCHAPDPADRTAVEAVEKDKSRFNSTASSSILLCHAPDPADRTAVEAADSNKSRLNSTVSSCRTLAGSSLTPKLTLGESLNQISHLEAYDISQLKVETIDDYLGLFNVHFIEKNQRRSTMVPVSVKEPESVAEVLGQVVYEPPVVAYEWACQQLAERIQQYRVKLGETEREMLHDLPAIFNNTPGDEATTKQLLTLKASCRKQAEMEFKTWKNKMLASISGALKEEETCIKEGLDELTAAIPELDAQALDLQQEKCEIEKREEELGKVSSKLPLLSEMKEKQSLIASLEMKCKQLETERSDQMNTNFKLEEQLKNAQKQLQNLEKSLETRGGEMLSNLKEHLSLLRDASFVGVEFWTEREARLTFLQSTLSLNIKFGEPLHIDWFPKHSHHLIKQFSFRSLLKDTSSKSVLLAHKLVLSRFPDNTLSDKCPDTRRLARLLRELSGTLCEARQLVWDVEEPGRYYQTRILPEQDSIRVTFSSMKCRSYFDLMLNVDLVHFPAAPMKWNAHVLFGPIGHEDIEARIQRVDPGHAYISRIISSVSELMCEKVAEASRTALT